ncbi:hypothetical protein HN604_02575 [archaeon]|nr:hypothetical protein [archaeon]
MLEKIKTKDEQDKKRRKNQLIVGTIMIGLLVLSTAGFSLLSSDDSEESDSAYNSILENGYEFSNYQGQWALDYNGQEILFNYLPSEVGEVVIEGEFDINTYPGSTLYFVGSGGAAGNEVLNVLGSYASKYQGACLEGDSCEEDLPTKSCDSNLIIFEKGSVVVDESGVEGPYENIDLSETKVIKSDNCVFLGGDQLRSADAFLYKLLGVID